MSKDELEKFLKNLYDKEKKDINTMEKHDIFLILKDRHGTDTYFPSYQEDKDGNMIRSPTFGPQKRIKSIYKLKELMKIVKLSYQKIFIIENISHITISEKVEV